ncbi:S24 family peptidase [Psychrobacter sanguinis]|uniref:S24 family peptidase n=1 Tax=Psychrobacter sanguinis TaxID=861445 RepID=UPI00191B4A23|nr:S24 family peptidase [Psychrobacter sanguinis]MCC3307500.1 helix-turn-helix domain-containing protein [Psychrobacter sanguinis]UEC24832.1 helix-turn-helix domain-containing protein [Psychrobacter sanguinis]
MSYLVSNLEFLLKKHGINAYQLQDKSGIPQSTTFRIINGDTQSPSSKTVKKYAEYFGIEEAELRFKDLTRIQGDNFRVLPMDNVRRVPVLNYVQAGEFCHYFDDAIADTFEIIIGDYPPHVHWVIIEGLSMTPDFNPGDLILVDPDTQPSPGNYVVAKKAGENAVTFKKWRPRGFDDNGVEYCELVPLNPDFPTIDSRHTPFTICGVAVEHKKKLK